VWSCWPGQRLMIPVYNTIQTSVPVGSAVGTDSRPCVVSVSHIYTHTDTLTFSRPCVLHLSCSLYLSHGLQQPSFPFPKCNQMPLLLHKKILELFHWVRSQSIDCTRRTYQHLDHVTKITDIEMFVVNPDVNSLSTLISVKNIT